MSEHGSPPRSRMLRRKSSTGAKSGSTQVTSAPRRAWEGVDVNTPAGRVALRRLVEAVSDADVTAMKDYLMTKVAKSQDRADWPAAVDKAVTTLETRENAIAHDERWKAGPQKSTNDDPVLVQPVRSRDDATAPSGGLNKNKRAEYPTRPVAEVRPVGAPPPSPARLNPTPEPNQKVQSAWTDILRGSDRQRVITDQLGKTADWPDIPAKDRTALVDGVGEALKHLSGSRMPAIQSIMHVAELATRRELNPTTFGLKVEVTDPIRIGDTVALGRASPGTVEISPYKPLRDHPVQSLQEASETLIHELTHWVSYEMYGGGMDGNPPWLTDHRLQKRKRANDTEENEQRRQTVEKIIETLEKGELGDDLNILKRILEYPKELRYKELLPHIIEFLAHLENSNQADALDKVLNTGGAGSGEVQQAVDQFVKDLERFQQTLNTKERHRVNEKHGLWEKVDVTNW